MGWIAAVAGSLIIAMFVYNWLNKGNSSLSPTEVNPTQKASSLVSRHQVSDRQESEKVERSIPQVQPPVMVAVTEPEEDLASENKRGKPNSRSMSPGSQSTVMPPPALPTITPAPAAMAPPPRSKSPPRLKPPTVGRPPAAPRPGGGALRPPPSAASSLRVPVTKVLSNTSMAPSSLMAPPKKISRQVALEPGHSPLDWAALTSNPTNKLRGKDAPDSLVRVTPSQLKAQNGRKDKDAWTVYQGKVYNITPYVPFHPGGKGEILRGAGKDSAKLFMEVHPWVNWDGMLAECCVGILVGEEEAGKENIENRLDEMD